MDIIPLPKHVEIYHNRDPFVIEGSIIFIPEMFATSCQYKFLRSIREHMRSICPRVKYGNIEHTNIVGADDKMITMFFQSGGSERYQITILPDQISIVGFSEHGMFYGARTLLQIMKTKKIPSMFIDDEPRFQWRGFMIDLARHYFDLTTLKNIVKMLSWYKLNRLHLHLTDDQGWRLEIPGYPELTEIGASKCMGDGPRDRIGYLSIEDFHKLVRFANSLYVEIVPEFDIPAHTGAALASIPGLNRDGKRKKLFTGDSYDASKSNQKSFCLHSCRETSKFLESIASFIGSFDLYYVHFGGDEAKTMKKREYEDFMEYANTVFKVHSGKKIVGWQESACSRPDILQCWKQINWRTKRARDEDKTSCDIPKYIQKFVSGGGQIIMSPADYTYLDMKRTSSQPYGKTWAGPTSVAKVYSFNPSTYFRSIPEKSIIGVEYCLWTEYITNHDRLNEQVVDRLVAGSEVCWTSQEQRDLKSFLARYKQQRKRRL